MSVTRYSNADAVLREIKTEMDKLTPELIKAMNDDLRLTPPRLLALWGKYGAAVADEKFFLQQCVPQGRQPKLSNRTHLTETDMIGRRKLLSFLGVAPIAASVAPWAALAASPQGNGISGLSSLVKDQVTDDILRSKRALGLPPPKSDFSCALWLVRHYRQDLMDLANECKIDYRMAINITRDDWLPAMSRENRATILKSDSIDADAKFSFSEILSGYLWSGQTTHADAMRRTHLERLFLKLTGANWVSIIESIRVSVKQKNGGEYDHYEWMERAGAALIPMLNQAAPAVDQEFEQTTERRWQRVALESNWILEAAAREFGNLVTKERMSEIAGDYMEIWRNSDEYARLMAERARRLAAGAA